MPNTRHITLYLRTKQILKEKDLEIKDTVEIKNKRKLLEDSFAQLDGLQNYLYGTENEHKLTEEYQRSLSEYMRKKYESKIVHKRYYNLDLSLYSIYKQYRQQKMQVKKKLAVVCARELKRAHQRTGKVNPALKGRRIAKLLALRLKKKKSSNNKLKEKMVEQQREQKKLNYLLNQTELFAHFVLKSETDKMKEVQKKIQENVQNENDQTQVQESQGLNVKEQIKPIELEKPPALKHFEGTLKDYQSKGLSWLINLYNSNINGILADDMGLGKTVQTIALLTYLFEKEGKNKFLIVTPVSTLGNWESEIKRFNPFFEINSYIGAERNLFNVNRRKIKKNKYSGSQILESSQEIPILPDSSCKGNKRARLSYSAESKEQKDKSNLFFSQENDIINESFDERDSFIETKNENTRPLIVLTSYQLINDKKIKKIKFDYLVCDEAQAIKSNKSLRWKNINSLQSKNRLLLTGTPIQNNMAELWALLHFIMPTLFNDHQLFLSFFSNEKSVKKETLDRLHSILKPFMLRREKKDVKNELGVKIEKEIICHMNEHQRKLYDEVNRLKENENMVMQLRKIVNHPALFLKEENGTGFFFDRKRIEYDTITKTKTDWENNLRVLSEHVVIKRKNGNDFFSDLKKTRIESHLNKKNEIASANIPENKTKKILKNETCIEEIKNSLNKSDKDNQIESSSISESIEHDDYIQSKEAYVESIRVNRIDEVRTVSDENQVTGDSFSFKIDSEIFSENKLEEKFLNLREQKFESKIDEDRNNQAKRRRIESTLQIESIIQNTDIEHDYLIDKFNNSDELIINKELFGIFNPEIKEKNTSSEILQKMERKYIGLYNQSLKESKNDHPLNLFNSNFTPKAYSTTHSNDIIKVQSINLKESGKFHVLDSMLSKMLEKRILIYFQMTKMMDLFEEYCKDNKYSYVRLDGALKPNERKKIVDKFQNENIFLFLLSTRAGGLGLNLTKANTVIFYDSDWNPTVDQQAMDRAYRLGNTMDVNVYRLITKDSVEEKMRDSAEMKEEIHRLVIDGGEYTF